MKKVYKINLVFVEVQLNCQNNFQIVICINEVLVIIENIAETFLKEEMTESSLCCNIAYNII